MKTKRSTKNIFISRKILIEYLCFALNSQLEVQPIVDLFTKMKDMLNSNTDYASFKYFEICLRQF